MRKYITALILLTLSLGGFAKESLQKSSAKHFTTSIYFEYKRANFRKKIIPRNLKTILENANENELYKTTDSIVLKSYCNLPRTAKEKNILISKKRGNAVKRFLCRKGFPAKNIAIYTYGYDPTINNPSMYGKEAHRVDILWYVREPEN